MLLRIPPKPPELLLKIIKRCPALGAAGAVIVMAAVAVPVNCTIDVFAGMVAVLELTAICVSLLVIAPFTSKVVPGVVVPMPTCAIEFNDKNKIGMRKIFFIGLEFGVFCV